MSTVAGGLKELHQLHIQLEGVRDQIERGPKLIQARHKKAERKNVEVEELKEQLKQLKMAADQKSLQMKTNDAKILDIKAKLNAASTNREYDIFKSQIEADTMTNSVLEDEILDAYEKVDAVQAGIGEAEADKENAIADEKRVAKEVTENEPTLLAECDKLQALLKEAESTLPSAVHQLYVRLVGSHGASALAAVENKACTNCFDTLSANMLVELNVGKYVFCRSCGRLSYLNKDD